MAAVAPAALSLAALLMVQILPAADPCRLPSKEDVVRQIRIPSLGFEVAVPAFWSERIEEHSGVVWIEDEGDSACRLVLSRHTGSDTAARIRRVHERLYLDRSVLDGTCGETRIRHLSKHESAIFGEYDRDGRSRVYAMFWSTGTAGFAALLTCSRGAAGDWRAALPLLSSIRRTAP